MRSVSGASNARWVPGRAALRPARDDIEGSSSSEELFLAVLLRTLAAVAVVRLLGFGFQQALAFAVGLNAAPLDAAFAGETLVFLALLGLPNVVKVDDISQF